MSAFWRKLGQAALRLVKRFIAGTPANTYEKVVFGATRDIALAFGKGLA